MDPYRRYALYYTPPPGDFSDFGAAWLGWDPATGQEVAQPGLPGLDLAALTEAPRRYGFHATLKAPFRLAPGQDEAALRRALAALAADLDPVTLDGLALTPIGGFLALTPEGDQAALNTLAAQVVAGLDPFRAPLSDAERARRNPDRLSTRQQGLLDRWGYPYVMDEFRFHMTLCGDLDGATQAALVRHLAPRLTVLPRPFTLDAISLMGEGSDGRFRLIERHAL